MSTANTIGLVLLAMAIAEIILAFAIAKFCPKTHHEDDEP